MFHNRLKSLRESHRLSQVDLANALGVTKQSISNWENDNIQPSIEMLVRIANYFHVKTDYLLGLDDHNYIYVSGLTIEQITHIQQIIDDIIEASKNCKSKNERN